jgi:hypothetical protein
MNGAMNGEEERKKVQWQRLLLLLLLLLLLSRHLWCFLGRRFVYVVKKISRAKMGQRGALSRPRRRPAALLAAAAAAHAFSSPPPPNPGASSSSPNFSPLFPRAKRQCVEAFDGAVAHPQAATMVRPPLLRERSGSSSKAQPKNSTDSDFRPRAPGLWRRPIAPRARGNMPLGL